MVYQQNFRPERFSEAWKGRIGGEDIDIIDSLGAADRILEQLKTNQSWSFEQFLELSDEQRREFLTDEILMSYLRRNDPARGILEMVRRNVLFMVQDPYYLNGRKKHSKGGKKYNKDAVKDISGVNEHVLLKNLRLGQKNPLAQEAFYWDIEVPDDQPQLDYDDAEAIFEACEIIANLPEEAQRIYPMNLEGFLLGHSVRTAIYASLLAKKVGISSADIAMAGVFHDIGKLLKVIQLLTRKDGSLNPTEYECVKLHTTIGSEVWRRFRDEGYIYLPDRVHCECIHDSIGGHHERDDGNGYPDNLVINNGNCHRIVQIGDCFDAMTSRCYKQNGDNLKIDPDYQFIRAREEIKRCSGLSWDKAVTKKQEPEAQFDPYLAEKFLEMDLRPVFYREAA